ncbi:hypothetical protein Dimus_026631, partial [Dionaea muscipula]
PLPMQRGFEFNCLTLVDPFHTHAGVVSKFGHCLNAFTCRSGLGSEGIDQLACGASM